MSDPKHILSSATSILLIDWSDPAIPRTLAEAGFTVFSASPGRYSRQSFVHDARIST